MRPISLGQLSSTADIQRALRDIERASRDGVENVADSFSITGTLTEARSLDVDSPSLANIAAVLGTLITDLKKRGAKRT